jgi:hypothetical protein
MKCPRCDAPIPINPGAIFSGRVLIYMVVTDRRPVLRIAQEGGEFKDYPLSEATIKRLLRDLAICNAQSQ